ncbi:hypothetical protein [Actinoplanes palleronii]|uniref:Transposase n=1 Tax=Actinoplanes palleronii TaxID=113570 RepID=A0ABQ4B9X8_9ACTN|nr:hypothetical protein [Actinoplanes palleronii]GIE67211.1 hypothetical protein Apa02nite_033190 [Actinoplanes palleronii]
MKVTRIAYSHHLNTGKYLALSEQARRLGRVRSEVWQRYGSLAGLGRTDRQIRDQWLADGTYRQFGVLTTPWKETVRSVMDDIAAARAPAAGPRIDSWPGRCASIGGAVTTGRMTRSSCGLMTAPRGPIPPVDCGSPFRVFTVASGFASR